MVGYEIADWNNELINELSYICRRKLEGCNLVEFQYSNSTSNLLSLEKVSKFQNKINVLRGNYLPNIKLFLDPF